MPKNLPYYACQLPINPPQHTMAYRLLPLSHHFHPVLFRLAMLEYPAVETQLIHNLPIPVTCSQWMLHGCMRVAVVAVSFLLVQVEHQKIPHLISTGFVLLARIVIAAVVAPTIIPASSMRLHSCMRKNKTAFFHFVPAVMPSVSPSKPFFLSPHPRET
ncbi:hypothetical protein BO94DRAFT_113428 [Aspergillus sclerotioniger CBS 115572]|uniref:Uncharacterized protein n=1 Tax=Aspergillus sclerotioniger CBS 115572 TaxID=1450535 RepID=A0A317WBL6_9EURO|nr:hypothetical protein BO94DRAFT_113428 [Aspergillus sclerotioniger CBS 115572]PWY83733.1 hypothetical protein BO94DRAFT_113428 [Aspergillus sclerotioniger CBS 115572]